MINKKAAFAAFYIFSVYSRRLIGTKKANLHRSASRGENSRKNLASI
tara:strand:+ start:691 stop:831 length:141 start_codon:yes stop_codon:yes gene_type:complete